MCSLRGHQFNWGPESLANQSTPSDLLLKMFKIHAFMRPALAFLVLSSQAKDGSSKQLLLSLGVPSFPGLDLLATILLNFSFGLIGYGCLELLGSTMTLMAFAIHKLCLTLHLPYELTEFFNPDLYPPITRPIFQSPNLSYFWGKAWHQNLRRCFLICGGKPALWVASRLRLHPDTQKAVGLFGAFGASAVLHEYGYVSSFLSIILEPLIKHSPLLTEQFPLCFPVRFLWKSTYENSDNGHETTASSRPLHPISILSRSCLIFHLTTYRHIDSELSSHYFLSTIDIWFIGHCCFLASHS